MIQEFLINGNIYELGRGGQGVILANDRYPQYVVKESNVAGRCGSWNLEYRTLKDINSKFRDVCPEAAIIKVYEFLIDGEKCYIMLDRIYRPDNNGGPAIQAYFGSPDVKLLNKSRGLYLGLKQLGDYLSEEKISNTIECLGRIISTLHYGLKYDGTDLEYILGHKYNEKQSRIYILDFDLVRPIENYDNNTINTLHWSLDSESYYPKPDGLYYDVFAEAYLDQADRLEMLEVARKVIKLYEEF